MAYIDHASAFTIAGLQPVATPWTLAEDINAAEPASFSALEWQVIALARRDRLASLTQPGPLARAVGGLFGLGRQSMLADPRLEALRRIAVHAWHRGYRLPVSEIKRFVSAGFSKGQVETLLASIAAKRTERRRSVTA